jgi:flagellar M-ring protein FliF
MDDMRQRVTGFARALPAAHKVGIASALVALAMLSVVFARWVLTPSYTVLYAGMEPEAVAGAVDQLEAAGVPYRLEAGGGTILVPREQLYETRASMAAEGFSGKAVPEGYELLADQGLSVSDFRQRVDYQRALEGEIAKTLMAMDGIDNATVHLVIPEEELFAEREEPVTASVLVDPSRPLDEGEVETVSFLVASSVEGLDVNAVTIADTDGTVLHAPGDAGASVATNRNLRQTREFEQALAGDVTTLLQRVAPGGPASVVVRANLNFDEAERQTETFDRDSAVATKEQTATENFQGVGALPGGAVGVDGGPQAVQGGDSDYQRDEALREFGVNKTTERVTGAPGAVEKLSVAIVMDDGSVTGERQPDVAEVEQLVTAALGLDQARGDTIAVSAIPFAAAEDEEEPEPEAQPLGEALPTIVGVAVLALVALALFLMTRRRKKTSKSTALEQAPTVVVDVTSDPPPAPTEQFEPVPAMVGASPELRDEVTALVSRQPEEIATLLRSWLADRRS